MSSHPANNRNHRRRSQYSMLALLLIIAAFGLVFAMGLYFSDDGDVVMNNRAPDILVDPFPPYSQIRSLAVALRGSAVETPLLSLSPDKWRLVLAMLLPVQAIPPEDVTENELLGELLFTYVDGTTAKVYLYWDENDLVMIRMDDGVYFRGGSQTQFMRFVTLQNVTPPVVSPE